MKKFKLFLIAFLILTIFSSLALFKVNANLTPSASQNELIVQPFSGTGSLEREILSAKKYVHIELYGFTSYDLFDSLVLQAKRGVEVKVMLEKAPYQADTENWDARYNLTKYGITCKWSSPAFFLTHAKFIVIDGEKVIVLTGNLTYSSFTKNREFGIILNDEKKASELEDLFKKDWARQKYENNDPGLVVSPIDSRVKIENALKSAKSSIKIWEQEVDDPSIIDILKNAKAKNIDVKIITPPLSKTPGNTTATNELGDSIRGLPNPYVHAKTFIIDGTLAYIGSNNFTTPSLEMEREVGVLTEDQSIIKVLLDLWEIDWANSTIP
jgi:phosphatidylserine/phosphatidylglycerophosphate/cardiolipin synthase-like enzyme